MTKQTKNPGMGLYFLAIILLLLAYYAFAGGDRTPTVTYAQVEDLFQREQVTSFYVRDGSQLYLNLQDGTTVTNTLGSVESFREELGDLIRQQKAAGILTDYNYDPVYSPPWWSQMLIYVLLIGGVFLLWQYMAARAQGGGGMDQGRRFSKAKIRFGSESKQKVSFADVAGADEEKEELREIVDFLQTPQKYLDLGARIPKGVLLVGPPGTGKTLLAKAVAGEAGVQFLSISGSDFVELYVGVGASRVRDLFDQAKKEAPAIVFIDEIDAVGRQRGAGLGGGHDEREQTLNQLLVEMDGFEANDGIIVMAATNRADILDKALLRPGRFDRQVYVGLPDVKGREEILKVHTRKKPLAPDVSLKVIAQRTAGFAGADLENLVNEAALLAARRGRKAITMEDIEEASMKVMAGPEKKSRVVTPEEKKLTAYHEAGHAVAGFYCKHHPRVHEITIIPRGQAGGYTMYLPEKDRSYVTKGEMFEDIVSSLGGRVAEQLILDDVSTGASNDLQQATSIARQMITRYGFSERLGPVVYGTSQEETFLGRDFGQGKGYSETTAAEIDSEIRDIIDEAYETCRRTLTEHIDQLHALAQALIEREKLNEAEFNAIMRGKHLPPRRDSGEPAQPAAPAAPSAPEASAPEAPQPPAPAAGDELPAGPVDVPALDDVDGSAAPAAPAPEQKPDQP